MKLGKLKNGNPAAPIERAWAAPRCGAKTRSGKPCKSPCVRGRKRCRMHGGAKGSGAPMGNQNALKHGYYTEESISKRRTFKDNRQAIGLRRHIFRKGSYKPRPLPPRDGKGRFTRR